MYVCFAYLENTKTENAFFGQRRLHTVDKFLVYDLGILTTLAGLSPARRSLCSLAGRYENPIYARVDYIPQSGIKNLSAVLVTAKDLFGRTLLILVQYAFTTITVHRTKLLMIGRNSVLLIQTSYH